MPVGQRTPRQAGPGPQDDVSDAVWLCQLAEAGLLKANFVPPKPIRQLRNLTRYRKTQIQERAREVNRLHKALEDAGTKLDCVAADIVVVAEVGVGLAGTAATMHRLRHATLAGSTHERVGGGHIAAAGCRSASRQHAAAVAAPMHPVATRRRAVA